MNNATRLEVTIKFLLTGADTFSSPSNNPFLHQASARQCEQEIPLFQPHCSDSQIVRSPFNQLLTDARTLCNVALGLACSQGVSWVGESLFVLLLPPPLILWQRKIGESRNSNQALSRAKTFTRPKKTPALQATLGQGWKPFSDLTGVEWDVWVNKCPVRLLKITLPLSTSSNSYSVAAGLFVIVVFGTVSPTYCARRRWWGLKLNRSTMDNGFIHRTWER